MTSALASSANIIGICNGRITPASGNPIINNGTAITTLYFTPFNGNLIGLNDGSGSWSVYAFSEISLSVPATTNTMYDIFVYNNSGTITMAFVAWTNDTTRATALVYSNGILCKSGATQYRYVGSFRTGSVSGQTILSGKNILVWNYYNQLEYKGIINTLQGSWVVNSNVGVRQLAGTSDVYTFNVVCGLASGYVHKMWSGFFAPYSPGSPGSWATAYHMGWGYNSTSAIQTTGVSAGITSQGTSGNLMLSATFINTANAGFQTYAFLEYCGVTSGSFTVYDGNPAIGEESYQQFTCFT